jgi:hypothetical protein
MSNKKVFWGFSAKDVVYILIIGAICFFGYQAYRDLRADVQQSNIAYKQLSETLARAQNELVTKAELKVFAEMTGVDLSKIRTDLKKVDADLSAVGQTVATIEGNTHYNQGSDNTTDHDIPEQPEDCKLCDIHGYTASVQAKDIKLGEMPIARAEFNAANSKPWTIQNDAVDVEVTTIVGKSDKEDVSMFYHEIALINNSRPELAGKKYKLKIVSSEFKQTLSSNKEFHWWNPKLDLSLDNSFVFDVDDNFYRFGGSIGISIMSYGRTTHDNDWRFIRLGVGMNSKENPYVTVEPIRYNLGRFIPLISDLWVGCGPLFDGGWGVNLSIGTTL